MRRALAGWMGATMAVAAAPCLAQPAAPIAAPGPKVDAPGKLPAAPPSVPDLAYDSRLIASFASAEQFQGALDGGWTLSAAGQGDLYGLQITDKRDELSGAWRDLSRPGQADASGLIDEIQRSPDLLVIRFGAAVVTLRPGGGVFRGELVAGHRRTPVVLRKAGP